MLKRCTCLTGLLFSLSAWAQEPPSLQNALSSGNIDLTFRYRYEHVDQAGFSKEANASTLKSRLTYTSANYHGWTIRLEADDVTAIGNDNFNSTRNGETTYPVVADPEGTEVNQAYVDYRFDGGQATLGRQRIALDDQRFVGGVAWRQNEQTFDAFRLRFTAAGWSGDYSYVNRVSRIFGPDGGVPDRALNGDIHFLNAKRDTSIGKVSLFGYSMDFDDASSLSNLTYGFAYERTFTAGDVLIPVRVSIAQQDDHGANPVSYTARYGMLDVGWKHKTLSANLGYEFLEGDNQAGKSFRTPLATLHKFQGWADRFLNTPAAGIEDIYVGLGYGSLRVIYHDFRGEAQGGSLGSELNVSWRYKFSEQYSVLLKYADYHADDFATDTRKAWLMFTATF